MKKILSVVFLLVFIGSFAGCNQMTMTEPEEQDVAQSVEILEGATEFVTVIDAKGREVTINTPIKTYGVSTMHVVDFLIPFMGADAFDMLVASGQDGGHGLQAYEALYTPVVGDYMSHVHQISEHNAPFDLEMILATSPDVLFINSAMGAHFHALDIEDQLNEAGIPFVLIDVPGSNVATSTQDTIRMMAKVFQKEAEAQEVIDYINNQFALLAIENLQAMENKPSVYYEMEIFGLTNTSALGGWGHLVNYAGGHNIADDALEGSDAYFAPGHTLDPEYIISANPEVVFMSAAGEEWMTNGVNGPSPNPSFEIVNRTGWQDLRAVHNNQIYVIAHGMERSVYSFNACQYIAKVLYPDLFEALDPQVQIQEFFERFMLTDSNITGWYYSIGK